MIWGLFKMMMCLVTVPLKLLRTMIKLAGVVLLPIMIMKALRHLARK